MATEVLRRIVSSRPEHQIVWCAKNGAEAVMGCGHEIPDLILMDLMMPVMDGVEATRRIMALTPCPILIVTSSVSGHAPEVFRAMGAGALDVVATPVIGTAPQDDMGGDLLKKISLIEKLTSPGKKSNITAAKSLNDGRAKRNKEHLIALGCSTGGPQAILEILAHLSADIQAAVVVIQHMDKRFTAGLVSWLAKQLTIPVRRIREGQRLKKGVVMIPDTNKHLRLEEDLKLSYTSEPEDNFYHPSIDVFFNSAAKYWPGPITAALLTGMGRDGAAGLATLHKRGCATIAQDKESSIVFGMPKAAIELGAAREILPLQEIGPRIREKIPS